MCYKPICIGMSVGFITIMVLSVRWAYLDLKKYLSLPTKKKKLMIFLHRLRAMWKDRNQVPKSNMSVNEEGDSLLPHADDGLNWYSEFSKHKYKIMVIGSCAVVIVCGVALALYFFSTDVPDHH
jgi:hypothetical protein